MKRKVFTLLVVFSLAMFVSAGTALGASTGGEGQSRWVELEIDGTDYTTVMNLTLPETISENHTLEGELNYTTETGSAGNTSVKVEFENDTGETWTFVSDEYEFDDEDEIVEFEIETNLPADEYEATVTLEDDTESADTTGLEDDLEVTVIDNVQYTLSIGLVTLLVSLLPVLIIVMVVFPMIIGVFKDVI